MVRLLHRLLCVAAVFVALLSGRAGADDQLTLGEAAADALRALASEAQPQGPNGWPLMLEAGAIANQIQSDLPEGDKCKEHPHMYDWSVLTFWGVDDRARQVAVDGLNRLRAQGFFDLLAKAAASPQTVADYQPSSELPAPSVTDLAALRHACLALTASMSLAFQERRWDEACEFFESNLPLAQAACRQPALTAQLFGHGCHSKALAELRTCLASITIPTATLERLNTILVHRPLPDASLALRGERIVLERIVDWVYGIDGKNEAANDRLAALLRGGDVAMSLLGDGLDSPTKQEAAAPATFADRDQMRAAAADVWVKLEAVLNLPCDARADAVAALKQELAGMPDSLVLVRTVAIPCVQFMQDRLRAQLESNGARLMLAIAMHRATHGSLPVSLNELPAEVITQALIDCITGQSIKYRVLDAGAGGYVLYSVGGDRVDDGGRLHPKSNYEALSRGIEPGHDFILNMPRESHSTVGQPHANP